MDKAINESLGNKCWCPMCDRHNQKIAVIAPWISPEGVLVCIYVVCKECSINMRKWSNDELVKKTNEVEENLLNKYPDLWKNLPDNYGAETDHGKVHYRNSSNE